MLDLNWDNIETKLPSANTYKKYEGDSRFWKISKNEQGKGVAIIRLLIDKNSTPTVRLYTYSLKKPNPFVPGKFLWFISNSPDSIGLPDPVKEKYNELLASNQVDLAKSTLRRNTKYITNILVVKDPANPENDGKVFLWEFGTKLQAKISSWENPSEDDLSIGAKPKKLFNPLAGHNIKLMLTPQGDFGTYDSTEVMPDVTSIKEGIEKDDAIKFIIENTHDLNEFKEPAFFDSYEVLSEKFNKWWTGGKGDSAQAPKEYSTVEKLQPKAPIVDIDDFEMPTEAKPSTKQAPDAEDDSWLNDL